MTGSRLLLVLSLLTGIFAQQCDLSELDVAEFSETVTVTNVSKGWTASVLVTFDHGRTAWRVPSGTSRTASGLLAKTYAVSVIAPESSRWNSYRERLEEARDEIVAITLDPDATGDEVANAAARLVDVVAALDQLDDTSVLQSCAGEFQPGVPVQATVDSTDPNDGTRLWVLDCN